MNVWLIGKQTTPDTLLNEDTEKCTLHRASDCLEVLEMLYLHKYDLLMLHVAAGNPNYESFTTVHAI